MLHGFLDLGSQPGIEPIPLAVKALSPNPWTTRESLLKAFFQNIPWFVWKLI